MYKRSISYRDNRGEGFLNDLYISEVLNGATPPRLIKDEYHSIKSSSTSSIFLDFTIENPQLSEIIKCLSRALFFNIKKCEEKGKPKGSISIVFNEEYYPLDNEIDLLESPALQNILNFHLNVYNTLSLTAETAVLSLAYIDRLISHTNLHLHATNWRRISLGSIIIASKVWEDLAVWNADFLNLFPCTSLEDLSKLEKQFLNSIRYMVTLKSNIYTKYFLELKSLSDKTNFPMKPPSKSKLKSMEMKSRNIQEDLQISMPHRCKSEDGSLNRRKFKKKKEKLEKIESDSEIEIENFKV